MKCPRCGSGKTVYHFGVYKCRKCKLYFLIGRSTNGYQIR